MKTLLCASTAPLALVLASVTPMPAAAADLGIAPIYQAPAVPLTTWTGSYVGIAGGGAWGSAPDQVRSAFRLAAPADTRSARVGIRVAREL